MSALDPRLLLLLLLLAACGGDGDDPGEGTGTLRVEAIGTIAPDFTDVAVRVSTRGGVPTREAVVRVTDVARDATVDAPASTVPGLFLGRLDGAVPYFRVEVRAGEDRLEGAVDGPRAFELTRPPAGALVVRDGADRLLLTWTRPESEPMDAVELSVVDPETGLVVRSSVVDGDPGEGRVPLPVVDGTTPLRASVLRVDRVELAGGREGSTLEAARSASVDFDLSP